MRRDAVGRVDGLHAGVREPGRHDRARARVVSSERAASTGRCSAAPPPSIAHVALGGALAAPHVSGLRDAGARHAESRAAGALRSRVDRRAAGARRGPARAAVPLRRRGLPAQGRARSARRVAGRAASTSAPSSRLVTNWAVPVPAARRRDGLTRNVEPHSPEWRACWAAADVFVMPTRNEAFGLVYQEAAAAGLPAIGTRHNAVPEIIARRRDGPARAGSAIRHALAAALAALAGSAELRHRLGARAREIIEERRGSGSLSGRA